MSDVKNTEIVAENIETRNDEAKHIEVAKQTAKVIKSKKMVEIKIPIDQQNKKDLIVPVIINGYRWEIKRGEKVSVPEPVAKILEDAKYI
jgi:hypothetical protein